MASIAGGAVQAMINFAIICTTLWLLDQYAHFDRSEVLDDD